ncbi:MAG TPA: universal stress protein [Herpetosiphonaceae bacterium]
MTQQILVPLDGSTLAETAISHAIVLARTTGGALHLLRTVVPLTSIAMLAQPMLTTADLERWSAAEHTAARAYLALVATQLSTTGLAVATTVVEGDPAATILALAAATPAIREIVVASPGRRSMEQWLFGSVAEKVVHAATVPVLVVPVQAHNEAPEMARARLPLDRDHRYATILVPLDGSAFAEQALEPARQLAQRCDAHVVLVSVIPVLDDLSFVASGIIPVWARVNQHLQPAAAAYLATIAQRLAPHCGPVRTRSFDGPPATMITAAAAEERADLIVMATHGRSGLSRLWLGSVATRVLQHTDRPVLLIRPLE